MTTRQPGLFDQVGGYMDLTGLETKRGQMPDSSLVAKPKRRQPPRAQHG